MKTIIKFENVAKKYQLGETSISALKNINFEIGEGEFVVILGASGAGKTTILNLLGGMDFVSSGSILVEGEEINKYNEKSLTLYRKNKIGFVFQFYNLIPNLNAVENVEFASSSNSEKFDAAETLLRVGLGERLKNFPAQLSGGSSKELL